MCNYIIIVFMATKGLLETAVDLTETASNNSTTFGPTTPGGLGTTSTYPSQPTTAALT